VGTQVTERVAAPVVHSREVKDGRSKALADRICQAVAICNSLVSSHPRPAIEELVALLATLRDSVRLETWRSAVSLARPRLQYGFLHEDPYTQDAYRKPRGYAGDAATLDFVYRYRSAEGATSLGQELFAISTDVPMSRAVRTRCIHLSEIITDSLQRHPGATIASIACGYMRELHLVPPGLLHRARVFGVDQDARTVHELTTLYPHLRTTPICLPIRRLVSGEVAIPQADLIYAAGLYDYLDDQVAAKLTACLLRQLRPGGKLVIANLTSQNEERAFMEVVMNWWLVYRDEDQLRRMAEHAIESGNGTIEEVYSMADGRVSWITLRSA
jgi:extracellular factor (EF) 3-hydroxypalmitic acid methyl ester biosynthesis protein